MGITRSPENTLIELVGITSFKSVLQLAGDTANLRTGHLKWQESGTKRRATVKRTVALNRFSRWAYTRIMGSQERKEQRT